MRLPVRQSLCDSIQEHGVCGKIDGKSSAGPSGKPAFCRPSSAAACFCAVYGYQRPADGSGGLLVSYGKKGGGREKCGRIPEKESSAGTFMHTGFFAASGNADSSSAPCRCGGAVEMGGGKACFYEKKCGLLSGSFRSDSDRTSNRTGGKRDSLWKCGMERVFPAF